MNLEPSIQLASKVVELKIWENVFLSVYMAGNPDTVGILFFQRYKMVIMCYVLFFWGVGNVFVCWL